MAQILKLDNLFLRFVEDTAENVRFITLLFSAPDVKKFFVLNEEHTNNIESFVSYMSIMNKAKRAFNFIIENKEHVPVGLITAELIKDNNEQIMWNVAYAIEPNHRNQHFAQNALKGLSQILSQFRIEIMMLDINEKNEASKAVARACGYKILTSPTGGRVGFIDINNLDSGMRLRWIKHIHETNPRDEFGKKAIDAYRAQQYTEAIQLYKSALNEEYIPGSLFDDGILYSNLGMAYSASGKYFDAYQCLKQAWALGCRNDSVIKELNWLRNNIGLD